MHTPPHIRVIAGALATAEAALGFVPGNTLVVQGLRIGDQPGGTKQIGTGLTWRLPAGQAAGPDADRHAAQIARAMRADDCNVLIVACYTMNQGDATRAAVAIRLASDAQIANVGVWPAGFHELPAPATLWPRSLIEAARQPSAPGHGPAYVSPHRQDPVPPLDPRSL